MNETNMTDSENMKSSDTLQHNEQLREQVNQLQQDVERHQLMNNLQSDGQFRLMSMEMMQRLTMTLNSIDGTLKLNAQRQFDANLLFKRFLKGELTKNELE